MAYRTSINSIPTLYRAYVLAAVCLKLSLWVYPVQGQGLGYNYLRSSFHTQSISLFVIVFGDEQLDVGFVLQASIQLVDPFKTLEQRQQAVFERYWANEVISHKGALIR